LSKALRKNTGMQSALELDAQETIWPEERGRNRKEITVMRILKSVLSINMLCFWDDQITGN
jgi:hypothetical protein